MLTEDGDKSLSTLYSSEPSRCCGIAEFAWMLTEDGDKGISTLYSSEPSAHAAVLRDSAPVSVPGTIAAGKGCSGLLLHCPQPKLCLSRRPKFESGHAFGTYGRCITPATGGSGLSSSPNSCSVGSVKNPDFVYMELISVPDGKSRTTLRSWITVTVSGGSYKAPVCLP